MTVALDIEKLCIQFCSAHASKMVVRDASLQVKQGEIVGLVGESGSGKSLTAMTALGLLPPNAIRTFDRLTVAGKNLGDMTDAEVCRMRGRDIALVPQEPMNSLNPAMRVGRQLELVIRSHKQIARSEARTQAAGILDRMLIEDTDRVMEAYPFELSGGMRQRVLLAMAFSCEPKVIVADEPTTALDVTVQSEVLSILRDCARLTETAVLFISHDLAVVWSLCDSVNVMRQGEIVESGNVADVIGTPSHPYTRSLLASIPANSARRTPLPVSQEGVT